MNDKNNLLTNVQNAIAKHADLKSTLGSIYILVNDGAVIVAGSVASEFLKVLIKKVVSAVPGVNLLIDDLSVESNGSRRRGVQIDWARGKMSLT